MTREQVLLRLSRRNFIKLATGIGLLLAVGKGAELTHAADRLSVVAAESPSPIPNTRWGMVIDLGKCIGCRRCMYACKRENNIPDTVSPPWIILFETQSEISGLAVRTAKQALVTHTMNYTHFNKDRWYQPVQCFHCDDPPCVKVCPTKATFKDPDGIVRIDYGKCIGCKYCMLACPYHARRFNWWEPELASEDINPLVPVRTEGIVEKCTFCVHRVRRGKPPRCVEVCPPRARHFGNLNDPDSAVSKMIENERNLRIKEELNTNPQIWYVMSSAKRMESFSKPLPPPEEVRGIRDE